MGRPFYVNVFLILGCKRKQQQHETYPHFMVLSSMNRTGGMVEPAFCVSLQ